MIKLKVITIKLLQGRIGLNQGQLAARAGLSKTGLGAILQRGTCKPENVIKIAKALAVEPELIIWGGDD